MKQITFTLLLLISIGLVSCRKDKNDPDIKQYDDTQIKNYIAANGITGMIRDTVTGDTSGIYYKILTPGTSTTPIDYSDIVSFVYTLRTLDGKYISTDSVSLNHFYGYAGHISGSQLTSSPPLPKGLQKAIHDLVKYKGTTARVIVPSHIGYGVNGYGLGSSTNANSHVGGNQSLDYYINLISNQEVYDDAVIKNYIKTNSLTGYTKTADGVYVKISTPGTGTDVIDADSYVTCTYTGKLLDQAQTVFDSATSSTSFTVSGLIKGAQEGLIGQTAGVTVSIIIPSRWAYGTSGNSGAIGPNTPLYFDFVVSAVAN
jgi:FKBP-type peptidyl-prolyl cis-trans isomerase